MTIGKHQPEWDRDQARAQHDAPEQADPVLAPPRTRHKRYGILAAVALPAIVVILVMSGGAGSSPSSQPLSAHATSATQRIETLLAGIPQNGNTLGSPTAPVTLQYFGDLQCPTSREFTIGALPFIVRKWVRPGKLRIEYRSLRTATPQPEVFSTQQVAALAAGMQGKLWYYLEFFYHEQGREGSGYVTESYLQALARQTPGLNLEVWGEDRHNPELPVEVAADERTAAGQGFRSTPSFLIGRTGGRKTHKLLQFSVLEPQAFDEAIEKLLTTGGHSVAGARNVSYVEPSEAAGGGLSC